LGDLVGAETVFSRRGTLFGPYTDGLAGKGGRYFGRGTRMFAGAELVN
jgi:hypothetical protein